MAKAKYQEREEKRDRRPEPVARDGAYVMMLIITLVAILAGCVLLYLDNKEYGSTPPPKEALPAIPKLGEAAKTDGTTTPPTPMP